MATVERTKVRFDSGGVACVGYVYHPAKGGGPVPCVVVGAGFSGTQDTPSIRAVVEAFAEAGFAALTFDYRHFGESGGTPRQRVRVKGQHEDFDAAIRCARKHAGIDPKRIALWGTSLGGGHVIAVAADDPRIAAVMGQFDDVQQMDTAGRSDAEIADVLTGNQNERHNAARARLKVHSPLVLPRSDPSPTEPAIASWRPVSVRST